MNFFFSKTTNLEVYFVTILILGEAFWGEFSEETNTTFMLVCVPLLIHSPKVTQNTIISISTRIALSHIQQRLLPSRQVSVLEPWETIQILGKCALDSGKGSLRCLMFSSGTGVTRFWCVSKMMVFFPGLRNNSA